MIIKIETKRHSYAHLMAASVLEFWPDTKLGIGPIIENGFYYDFDLKHKLTNEDLPKIEEKMRELIKKKLSFKRSFLSYLKALQLFRKLKQSYKIELIKDLKGEKISIYQTGDFLDLCAGPHVKSTQELDLQAFKLTRLASAYWKGSEKNPQLQRIYGVAFETKKELDDHLKLQEEIAKRDHRELGKKLDLFSFHEVAPGAVFWHPKGMVIIKELEKLWLAEHETRGYLETSTPIMVKKKLFEQSGHWEHYQENIFTLEVENETYALKPMNCPESTLIYSSKIRSYRDLPLRLSEIGHLHRNERSGVLSGLFRVRQITMDDAHLYVRPDQILNEISSVLDLIKNFYKIFQLKPRFYLATRPEEAMGDPKLWRKAESSLEIALKKNKLPYEVKEKEGAFYGPKIDIHITDALSRSWQVATIQLDFQMPQRFDLKYTDKKGKIQRPVMIHRAVFGSFERFVGILLEHYAGALPFWLSPVQIVIVPIADRHKQYAKKISENLNNYRLEIYDQNETVGKKIREAELQKIPYVLVVGDREVKNETFSVRSRDKGDLGEMRLEKFFP